jgi:hypothetical protein
MVDVLQYDGGRIVPMPVADVKWKTREDYLADLEQARRAAVRLRRAYYDGRQYDGRNAKCREDMLASIDASAEEKAVVRAMAMWDAQLPEHLRLHEYSTQIAESVDFVANRLADSARVILPETSAAAVVAGALDASPELAGTPDDEELVLVNVFRDAVKVGDVPVLVRWNGTESGTCWLEFWDSEIVEMRWADDNDTLTKVIVEQVDWLVPPGSTTGDEEPVTIRREWLVRDRSTVGDVPLDVLEQQLQQSPDMPVPEGPLGVRLECAEDVYLVRQDEDVLLRTVWWGVPFLPWWLVRGDKKSIRATRGEALISDQTMKAADRYNAVEQVSWLICRYNSHSNVAVTGDAMMIEKQHKVVKKDVADVMVFPGSTSAVALSLPTDAQMIEHQTETLKDGMYGSMGVTRVDQSSLEGLGGVTGYALEILDQKSTGTFSRIRQQLTRDLKRLVNLILDCHAYWSAAHTAQTQDDTTPAGRRATSYLQIDPASVFPKRAVEIRLGTSHIVDDARIRDDYVSKLISLEEALRQKGYDDPHIQKILKEMQEAAERAAAAQREAFGETGTEGTRVPASSTQTGRRFADSNRPDPAAADARAEAS